MSVEMSACHLTHLENCYHISSYKIYAPIYYSPIIRILLLLPLLLLVAAGLVLTLLVPVLYQEEVVLLVIVLALALILYQDVVLLTCNHDDHATNPHCRSIGCTLRLSISFIKCIPTSSPP